MIARRSFLRTSILSASLMPVIPAMPTAAPATVSPKLAALIAEYLRLTAELDTTELTDIALDQLADTRMRAVDALLDYRPMNLGELRAKLEAMVSFVAEDVELVSLQVLIDDIRSLEDA
jgi:hypothetical protein